MKKPKVLLVDDYPGIRESLGHALRSEDYDVVLASNGLEALKALRETGFDLILLDLDMPVVDGWETLGQIVTINFSLRFIIITGCFDQQSLATQTGVAAVLQKPLDMNRLLEVMEQALAEMAEARRQRITVRHLPSDQG